MLRMRERELKTIKRLKGQQILHQRLMFVLRIQEFSFDGKTVCKPVHVKVMLRKFEALKAGESHSLMSKQQLLE